MKFSLGTLVLLGAILPPVIGYLAMYYAQTQPESRIQLSDPILWVGVIGWLFFYLYLLGRRPTERADPNRDRAGDS